MGGSSVTYLLRPQTWRALHVSKQSDIHQHCCQMTTLTALSGSINNLGTEAKRKYKQQTLSDLYSKRLHYCLMTPIIICYLKWWLLRSFYRWESWGMTKIIQSLGVRARMQTLAHHWGLVAVTHWIWAGGEGVLLDTILTTWAVFKRPFALLS